MRKIRPRGYKRDKVEIIEDVLVGLRDVGPMSITRLLTFSNLGYKVHQRIMKRLTEEEYVMETKSGKKGRFRYYELTPKGADLLTRIGKVHELVRSIWLDSDE